MESNNLQYQFDAIQDLLALIGRMNDAILQHKAVENTDTFAINQYTERRQRFVNELENLMRELNHNVQARTMLQAA